MSARTADFSASIGTSQQLDRRGRIPTNLESFTLTLAKRGAGELPFVSRDDETPATPQVYLQIWSYGLMREPRPYGPKSVGGGVPELDLDPLRKAKDRRCAEIGGYIRETASGAEFCALEQPVRAAGEQRGWFHLELGHDVGPRAVGFSGARVPIVTERRDEQVVIAVGLSAARLDDETKPPLSAGLAFVNLTHVIGSQLLHEGGLTVCFHLMVPHATGDDAAFPRYGEWVGQRIHSLGLDAHGALIVGSAGFHSGTGTAAGEEQILQMLSIIRREAKLLVGESMTEVRVRRLVLLTHGDTVDRKTPLSCVGLMMGHKNGEQDWISAKGDRFEKFVKDLSNHLTQNVVVTVGCCWAGAPPESKALVRTTTVERKVQQKDGTIVIESYPIKEYVGDYCKVSPLPAQRGQIGAGSFADKLRHALAAHDLTDAAVWGHASKGDALFNMQLRVFTQHGNMDLCYLALTPPWREGGRLLSESEGVDWTSRFIDVQDPRRSYRRPGVWRGLDASFLHPGAQVATRLLDVPPEDETPIVPHKEGEALAIWPGEPVVVALQREVEQTPGPRSVAGGVAQLFGFPLVPVSAGLASAQAPAPEDEELPRIGLPEAAPGSAQGGSALLAALENINVVGFSNNPNLRQNLVLREGAFVWQLFHGNMPAFCRQWIRVPLKSKTNTRLMGAVWVLADVLAIGTDADYVRVPLSAYAAQYVASTWGCGLPTAKVYKDAWEHAATAGVQLMGHPFGWKKSAEFQMSNEALVWHDNIVQGRVPCEPTSAEGRAAMARCKSMFDLQLSGHNRRPPPNTKKPSLPCSTATGSDGPAHPARLVIGHKKEVVISKEQDPDAPDYGSEYKVTPGHRLTFFGLRKLPGGAPPGVWYASGYGASHGAGYADYSHGVRLVHPWMRVGDDWRRYDDVLRSKEHFHLVTDEGTPFKQTAYPALPKDLSGWRA